MNVIIIYCNEYTSIFKTSVVISKVRRKNYHFTHILFLFLFFTIHLVKKYEIIYIYTHTFKLLFMNLLLFKKMLIALSPLIIGFTSILSPKF